MGDQYFLDRGTTTPLWSFTDKHSASAEFHALKKSGADSVIIDFHLEVSGLAGTQVSWEDPSVLSHLKAAIKLAGKAGLSVWIKPIVLIGDPPALNWQQLDPSNKDAFFAGYKSKILKALGEDSHGYVSHVLLSNELARLTTNPANAGHWKSLVNALHHARSDVELGFNAGGLLGDPEGQSEFERIPDSLYSLVDFVGISAYPRVTGNTASDFVQAWHHDQFGNDQVGILQHFFLRNSKPIYFTELGYNDQKGADAAFFDGSFKVIAGELSGRVAGVFPYAWMLNDTDRNSAWETWGLNHKTAEGVLANWFSGLGSVSQTNEGDGGDNVLYGTSGGDLISGQSGNDTLHGYAGNDIMTGDDGADRFVFEVKPGSKNADDITDFHPALDKIVLDHDFFKALQIGGLSETAFFADVNAREGHDRGDRIVYDTSSGDLWYDKDGKGGVHAKLIASVDGAPALGHFDILVGA